MKRIYKAVAVEAAEGGFVVRLDKRELKSPAGAPLVFPTRALADAVAAEWDAQDKDIRPRTMPLMQLAATAVDLVGKQREAVIDGVAAYAETDLVCYRADRPRALVERQEAVWQPLVDWALRRYDAPLAVHAGIMPRPQPPATLAALRRVVGSHGDWLLTALQSATAAAGSLVIALAMLEGRIDAAEAFDAAQLDETFNIETWGEDQEAADRRARLREDLAAARRFVELARG